MQAGEAVLTQPWRQPPRHALRVIAQAVAGIAVITDEVSNFARRIANRLNDCFIPEQGAVRAIVPDQDPGGFALLHGFLDLLAGFLILIRSLQHAQVGPEKRGDWIPAHLCEGGIGINDRMIRYRRIAHDDAFRSTVHDTAPRLGGPVVHVLPASRFNVGAAAQRASSSRLLFHSGTAVNSRRGTPSLPCIRTRRSLDVGSGSTFRRSSNVTTPARLLHTGSMSQPAERA